MRKRQGYTKRALQEQIGKYEKALKMTDESFDSWLLLFGSWPNCPVCSYRHRLVGCDKSPCLIDDFEPCLAIVDNIRCESQYWFGVVKNNDPLGFPQIRRNLSGRLEFWKKVYAEKYPGGIN